MRFSPIESAYNLVNLHLEYVKEWMDSDPEFAKAQLESAINTLEKLKTVAIIHERIVHKSVEKERECLS